MHYMARQHSQKKSFERDRWEEKSCNLDLSKGVLDDAPIYRMAKVTPGFRYKNIFEYDKFEKSAEKFLLRALVRQNLGEHMWDLIKSTARAAHAEYSKILAENPDDVDRLVCVETDLSAYDRQEKEVSRRAGAKKITSQSKGKGSATARRLRKRISRKPSARGSRLWKPQRRNTYRRSGRRVGKPLI